ncbi:hypothetical protein SLS57_006002 [Botryosphaeria dothidea]
MTSELIRKVAVVGASGNTGRAIVDALLSRGFVVTAVTRASTNATFPAAVSIKTADLEVKDSLYSAFRGQDAVVSAIAKQALDSETTLIDAAVEAKVKRFIPSYFGFNSSASRDSRLRKAVEAKMKSQEYLEKLKAKEAKAHKKFLASLAELDRLQEERDRLHAEQEKARLAYEESLRRQEKELRTVAARLKRLRDNQRLLEERGFRALLAKSDNLNALYEHDRREAEELLAALAEDEGYAPDPENSEGPSASKRPRHETVGLAAPHVAESTESAGEPVAGTKSPRSPELMNSARLSPYLEDLPLFSFGDDLVSVGG